MITFLFIIGIFALAFITSNVYRGYLSNELEANKLSENEINKKIQPIGKTFLAVLIIGILFINFSGYFKTDEEINSIKEKAVLDSIQKRTDSIVNLPPAPLTPEEQFLSDNGFKTDAGFTESQFKEFKSTINSGLFKKESFCEVYKKALRLEGNELKSYLRKFKKISYFETILFMYGPKVCDMTSSRLESSSSSSYINSDDSANPCVISEDFIKQDLQNPSTADFSMFDCSADKNSDGTYTVLRKVSAKNSYGVEKEFIYKLKFGFKGGNWVDINNWTLINIQSEEYK